MEREQRERLRALADAATPGPWDVAQGPPTYSWSSYDWDGCTLRNLRGGRFGSQDVVAISGGHVAGCRSYTVNDKYEPRRLDPDAAFIAASRDAIPALLDALEAVEAERDRWQASYEEEVEVRSEVEAERDEAVVWVRSLARTAVDPSPTTKAGARAFLSRLSQERNQG